MSLDNDGEVRRGIDILKNIQTNKPMQVVVSYDCSDIHSDFAEQLRKLLVDELRSEFITKSNYRITESLSSDKVIELVNRIKTTFNQASLKEGTQEKNTTIKLVLPTDELKFDIITIIHESII